MKNVLFNFVRPRYYLTHPLKFFHDFIINLRNAWDRATKGYCCIDIYNFYSWFLEIAPEMLQELSNDRTYPDTNEFDTFEKWQNWLREQANNLIACREEEIDKQNEYTDEFSQTLANFKNDANHAPEVTAIRDKYFARALELQQKRKKLLQYTLNDLGRNWFLLWS